MIKRTPSHAHQHGVWCKLRANLLTKQIKSIQCGLYRRSKHCLGFLWKISHSQEVVPDITRFGGMYFYPSGGNNGLPLDIGGKKKNKKP